jgi:hypothetical protein
LEKVWHFARAFQLETKFDSFLKYFGFYFYGVKIFAFN